MIPGSVSKQTELFGEPESLEQFVDRSQRTQAADKKYAKKRRQYGLLNVDQLVLVRAVDNGGE